MPRILFASPKGSEQNTGRLARFTTCVVDEGRSLIAFDSDARQIHRAVGSSPNDVVRPDILSP